MGDKCQPRRMKIKHLRSAMLGVPPPFDPRLPGCEPIRPLEEPHASSEPYVPSDPCKRPRSILKLGGEVCVLILGIAYVDFWKSRCILCLRKLSLCVESLSQIHNRETILSLLSLFGKPLSVFPIGCCGHAVLDCVWLVGQFVQHSLQVREVIEVGRIGCFSCERLSLGERVHRGRRELLEGTL
jgi:hypothetical protein